MFNEQFSNPVNGYLNMGFEPFLVRVSLNGIIDLVSGSRFGKNVIKTKQYESLYMSYMSHTLVIRLLLSWDIPNEQIKTVLVLECD